MPVLTICLAPFVALSLSVVPAHAGDGERRLGDAPPAQRTQSATPPIQSGAGIPGSERDEAAVKDLVSRYNAARDRQDTTALAALLTENADQLVSSGEWRRGRAALVRGMLQSSGTNPGARTITVDTVRFLGADVALVDARYEIAGTLGADPRRMWSAFLIVRTPEGWRIAAIRNMLPAR